jgi:uncharacterized membrane protein YeiH
MLPVESWSLHSLAALELIGTAAFALSGVLSAMRKQMDVVGIVVCGFLAAFGGGTLRDVLMDRRPFFWVEHQAVLVGVFALCVGCATFFRPQHLERSRRVLQVADAMGLGLFCTTGLHLAWTGGQPAMVALMMGVITATFGGVLRDIVCNEIPQLFHDHRPYAVCALAGGVVYSVLASAQAPEWITVAACTAVATGSRLMALGLGWRLPAIRR